ncbi:MAG TPA: hypothetical protein VL024_01850 [Castellaniella sp.]|nr:hypothetical protein [Castellaniella sp.]
MDPISTARSQPFFDGPAPGQAQRATIPADRGPGGICLRAAAGRLAQEQLRTQAWLSGLGLRERLLFDAGEDQNGPYGQFRLCPEWAARWAPGHDTLGLAESLGLHTADRERDLDIEILLSMLLSPVPFELPSHDELVSAVRIRRRIVQAARRTVLAFDTEQAERPPGCWTYAESTGFTLVSGHDLVYALRKATQPDVSGNLYSFSCYRATEYVLLLALAQELRDSNPVLLRALQHQWETRAIMSGEFHEVFLHEYGSLREPLPPRYYVPGDRLWFRNPDEASANIEGYEGSWVFYLGDGRFSNFWKPDQHYTLTAKCLEIHHWRHGVRHTAEGRMWMDENAVEGYVTQSAADPTACAGILTQMQRLRDPAGVYEHGGCVDASREYIRCVRPGTCTVTLPADPARRGS